jgi:hypothetical protein
MGDLCDCGCGRLGKVWWRGLYWSAICWLERYGDHVAEVETS